MKVAVVGGTGTLGRAVVTALAGQDVVALGRSTSPSIDLRDGARLDEALQAVNVVIDASNGPAGTKAAAVFVEGSRRLLAAQARAGVSHHVAVSIVGCGAHQRGLLPRQARTGAHR
jgi:nucleoside-diphosphate-sugar epimerase